MTMINAFDPSTLQRLPAEDAKLVQRRIGALGPAYRLFYERPLHIVRGEGVYLFASDGRRYLDAYNNVASVGHCHPHVVQAIARQAAVLNTHSRYLHEDIVRYSERLLARLPDELEHVMFTCTGSEANDLALRVARIATGGQGIVVTSLAYHGVTAAIAELSPSLGPDNPLGAHVRTIAPPDAYRQGAQAGPVFLQDLEKAFADLERAGIKPCALLVDTIFASDGILPEPRGLLGEAAAIARAAGALFIADEVQPGFGRVGQAFWGFARHGVVPDIVTMGKPMGNGHPVAAAAFQARQLEAFGKKTRYFNTFGGNPVSMAAASAVMDVLEREQLPEHAEKVGQELRQAIGQLQTQHPVIGDVRGAGLFVGVELVKPGSQLPDGGAAARVVNGLRERGVLVSASGPGANVLKVRPPLPFASSHVAELMAALGDTLCEIESEPAT